jgi:oligo-1,6-glucosidase/alpha-glucosidase
VVGARGDRADLPCSVDDSDGDGTGDDVGERCLPDGGHARWCGTPERPQVHLPFNFELIESALLSTFLLYWLTESIGNSMRA